MSNSCPSASTHAGLGSDKRTPWLAGIFYFLNRRRIVISAVVFVALIGEDVLTGVKPHDLLDYRDPKSMIGLAMILVGLALRSWAAGILKKDTSLATSGPYGLIRNPLYVGSFLMMVGVCTVIDDTENVWVILGPILFLYLLKVRSEETGLAQRFGGEWALYRQQTPRFFPRRLNTNGMADWRLGQWLRSREYRAVGSTLLALLALKIWHGI